MDNIRLTQIRTRSDTTHLVDNIDIDILLPPDFPVASNFFAHFFKVTPLTDIMVASIHIVNFCYPSPPRGEVTHLSRSNILWRRFPYEQLYVEVPLLTRGSWENGHYFYRYRNMQTSGY
jgi:hypothetical protein